jgi:asparagine synthase (glutamine-hydrolysing)
MSLVRGAERHYAALTFFRFPQGQRAQLFTPEAQAQLGNSDSVRWIAEHYHSPSVTDDLDRLLYTEQMTRMPEHDLRIGDRMSMAHGLEMRVPLVDCRVLEFAASLPSEFKVRPGRLKVILRELARRFYPPELTDRSKLGFGFPMGRWFKGPLAGFITQVLDEAGIFRTGLLDKGYADRILREHQSGRVDHNFKIWNLLNLEVWHRLFLAGESREEVRAWLAGLLPRKEVARDGAMAG